MSISKSGYRNTEFHFKYPIRILSSPFQPPTWIGYREKSYVHFEYVSDVRQLRFSKITHLNYVWKHAKCG